MPPKQDPVVRRPPEANVQEEDREMRKVVGRHVRKLSGLPIGALLEIYEEEFGESTPIRQRDYLLKRLAYRLQQRHAARTHG